jgi:NSS family neurotransmitter:Na+ symporter
MAETLLNNGNRENWGSRSGFILAAIGSAVGLGNLWAFPYKVYDNGGGAFLIPYFIAMGMIGIPVLILEFSLGHMTQRAAPDAYRSVNRRTEPIGWWGILLGFVIITYYPVILAWCGSFLWECVQGILKNHGELAWKAEGLEGIKKHFFTDYLQLWPDRLPEGTHPWSFGKLIDPIVLSLGIIWVIMYFCIFRGVKLVSKVVLWTVPLPWVMLLILTIRGLTLPGAATGLNFYLDPDWSYLVRPETWRWAFGQMFFSMSLAFGVMITYASFLHHKSDINNNAVIIGLSDMATSFVAGIAVFATLGAMTFATAQAGQAVPVTQIVDGGPSLAFVAFPYALAQLPHSAWFGAVFFIALLTLGIDSAFSITESVLASLVDKTRWNRDLTLLGLSLVGFMAGLVYCTQGGLSWLGTIDDFINSGWGGIALLGMLECVTLGWAYRVKRFREHANERSDFQIGAWWDIIIRYVAPLILSTLFAWSMLEKTSSPGGFLYNASGTFQIPSLVGIIVAITAPILAVLLSLIHSPGANEHAQHVGQRTLGQSGGVIGCLFALAGLIALVCGFYRMVGMQWGLAEGKPLEEVVSNMEFAGFSLAQPLALVWSGGGLALVGILLGAGMVTAAERSRRNPGPWGRLAAGIGVMLVGCTFGLSLAFFVATGKIGSASGEKAKNLPSHLTDPSYIVLAVVSALFLFGFGWCFYKAVTASGKKEILDVQLSEGSEE